MKRTMSLLTVWVACSASLGFASEVIRIEVLSHAPIPNAASSEYRGIVFTEDPLIVNVRVTADAPTMSSVLQWEFTTTEGQVFFGKPSSRATASTKTGSNGGFMQVNLLTPPPGDYDLVAVARGGANEIRSNAVPLAIRNGNEDSHTRRVYLRVVADKALQSSTSVSPFFDFKAKMLELAALEPDNPWVFERLAEVSLNVVPIEETLTYYAKAYEIGKRNFGRRSAEGPLDRLALQAWERFERRVTALQRIYPIYKENRNLVRLEIRKSPRGQKRLALVDRPTGALIRYADSQ